MGCGNSTEKSDETASKADEPTFTASRDPVEGKYQCTAMIGGPDENEWHHVTVQAETGATRGGNTAATFKWCNKAGVEWRIDADGTLHEDCPSFDNGQTSCEIEKDSQGIVQCIIFEGGRYDRCGEIEDEKDPLWGKLHVIAKAAPATAKGQTVLFIPGADTTADWRDLLYLAALPISALLNTGLDVGPTPLVLMPSEKVKEGKEYEDDDAMMDFLEHRLGSVSTAFAIETPLDKRLHFAKAVGNAYGTEVLQTTCLSTAVAALHNILLQQQQVNSIVVADVADYSSCLLAASIAGYTSSSLLFSENGSLPQALHKFCEGKEATFVGLAAPPVELAQAGSRVVRHVHDFAEAVKEFPGDYVAIANPNDREDEGSTAPVPQVSKLSLVAPALAMKHRGLVFAPCSVPISPTGPPAAEEPAFQEMKSVFLQELGDLQLRYICLVGSLDSVPALKTTLDLNGTKDYCPTDYCYAVRNFDLTDAMSEQPASSAGFADFAVSRIYTHSAHLVCLLAARCCAFEILKRQGGGTSWEECFMEAGEWGYQELRPIAQRAGLVPAKNHAEKPNGIADPIREADFEASHSLETALIAHRAHSGWSGLGNCMNNRTETLFAPCVFISRGCHSCGIDEGTPSVASRVMGRGAICYTGSPRSPHALNTHFDIEFFNALLGEGCTIGEANAFAYNRHLLMKHERMRADGYSVYNRLVLGDPALRPFPSANGSGGTSQFKATVNEPSQSVTVEFTGQWEFCQLHEDQLTEWNYKPRPLLVPVAAGAAPATTWCDDWDSEVMQYVVSVPIHADATVASVLYVRPDGSKDPVSHYMTNGTSVQHKLLLWRIPDILDYDVNSGDIKSQFEKGDFCVEFTSEATFAQK